VEKSFIKYYIGTIVKPNSTLEKLITDDKKIKFGFYSVLITAILYTFVYLFLILGEGQPFKPWLDIPIENYYRYNVFFCAASMFLGWILSVGVIHTLSRLITSNGTFEQSLAGFGFGIGIASWTTGIHDLLTSFLGGIHVINQRDYEIALNSPTIWRTLLWIQMIAYLIWFVILFSKSVKVVYRLSTGQSILLGTIGYFIYQLFFFIFNR
jgi:hypothetical protein